MNASGAAGGGIFLSYRRQESSHFAGRLYDRLADCFGAARVFIDVDTIEPGADFAQAIGGAVATCAVLLAIIGPHWLTVADEAGRRRLEDPDDIVRLEIESALARDVRVIPILVEGAVMPRRQDLPESLAGLLRRHAFVMRHESFRADAERLIASIEAVGGPFRPQAHPGPAEPPGEAAAGSSGRWRLELVAAVRTRKTFRLSAGDETYKIVVHLAMLASDTIEVDGDRIRSENVHGQTFPLPMLSMKLKKPASIAVRRGNGNTLKSLLLTIGDEIVSYQRTE